MNDQAVEQVSIPKLRYEELLCAERKLNALEAGGVDNWQWYDDSLENAGVNGKGELLTQED